MRALIFNSLFLKLFTLLSVLVGRLEDSPFMVLTAGVGALATSGWSLRRALLKRQAPGWEFPAAASHPAGRGWMRQLSIVGLALGAAFAEWIVLEVALHPWVEPPPGPVRGDISVHGVDYGKGVVWSPTVCRPATNPGVAAAALMERTEPHPVAWIVGRPDGEIGAIDIQRDDAGPTTRFLPTECTRVHGRVKPVGDSAVTPGLTGFADAECDHRGNHLTLHVDFDACAPSRP